MKLVRAQNISGPDLYVNPDRITYITSTGTEGYHVYFGKDDKITITEEGMEALINAADQTA